jgi:hypothetical protein
MTALPVAFRSNAGEYKFSGTTELVNAYAEQMGSDGKGSLAVLPADGLIQFSDTTSGPCRGMIFLEDTEALYSIHSSFVYKINSAGTATQIGIIPGVDTVQLSRNQKTSPQIVVNCGAGNLIIENDIVSFHPDPDLPSGAITAEYASGRHLYGFEDRTWFASALNDAGTIDGLDFATFEQKAGKLVRIKEHSGEVFGFCSTWLEAWRDTGNADFAYEPLTWKPRGLKAAHAVVDSDNTLMFPGNDDNIYRLNGYDPVVISTHEVARLVQNDASGESIHGFNFERDGHAFASWTGTTWTRVYDSATKVWHSRKSYGYDRWRANHSAKAFGKTLVGDRLSGKIFYLDKDTFTEDSETMVWQVTSPPMHAFPHGGIVDALHLDLATGYGTLSGSGSDPKVMLETSTDGGNTFTQYRELELGAVGRYAARVTARRLGRFGPKGMVFRVSISDPVVRSLVGVDASVRPLKR